ncbi:MAG: hypothetical protein QOK43_2245 [Acidimicrobiaceae bacterium]|nr:hypothetical protein [Acidimicrobiaceae bacterium]
MQEGLGSTHGVPTPPTPPSAPTGRTRSKRARLGAVTAAFVGVSVGLFAWAQAGAAEDPNAGKLRAGLQSFATKAAQLASSPELTRAVPMTGINPAQTLSLDHVFNDVMAAIPTNATSVGDLADKLNDPSMDADYGTAAVHVIVGCATGESSPGDCVNASTQTLPNGHITLTVPLRARRVVNTPLSLDTASFTLNGGTLQAAATLATTLTFDLDPTVADPAHAFSLVSPATLTFGVAVDDASPLAFTAHLGFTDVTVGGTITTARLGVVGTLVDPDGSGAITQDEWTSTNLQDLVTLTPSGAVDAALTLDTPLTSASPDATLPVNVPSVGADFPPVAVPGLGRLADFSNVQPETVVAGLSQLANGLQGLKQAGDPRLPFLGDGLGKVLDVAQPVLNLVDRESVVCGTANGNPPTGDVSHLPANAEVFCQARVSADPTTAVTWTIANGTPATVTSPAADHTVGLHPDHTVSFHMATPGTPDVTAAYSVGAQQLHIGRPALTAQQLKDQLRDVAGFQDVPDAVHYEEADRALVFHLRKTFDPGQTPHTDPGDTQGHTVTFDIGDQLQAMGIKGLSPGSTANVQIDTGQVTLDLNFGVLLVPQATDITPADNGDAAAPPGEVDRFFLKVNPSAAELSYQDAAITANLDVKGAIGYLEVAATGDGTAPGADGHAFEITKRSDRPATDPVLAVNLDGPGISETVDGSAHAVAAAIRIRDLLGHLTSNVHADLNAQLHAGLAVSTSLSGTQIAGGKVGVSWPNVTTGVPTVQADTAFGDSLRQFGNILGPDPAHPDPQALLGLILDNLDSIAHGFDSVAGSAGPIYDTRLPLVGISARDVVTQFRRIQAVNDELRGAPGPVLACGTLDRDTTANPPRPLPSMPANASLDALPPGTTTVYCAATNPKNATAVHWSVDNATAAPANAGNVATVKGAPDATFSFTVTDKQAASDANPTGWKVKLDFTDEDGDHNVEIPEVVAPTTLQKLERAIEEKLHLPAEALTLALKDFNGQKNLVIRLNFSECTDGTNADPAQHNIAVAGCAVGDRTVPKKSIPIAFDLGPSGGLVGIGSNSSVNLEYIARAKLNLAIPLSASPVPQILDSSGVDLQAGLSANDLNVTANLGPLSIQLGTAVDTDTSTAAIDHGHGAAVFGAGFTLSSPNNAPAPEASETPQSITTFASGAQARFTNPATTAQGCGSLDDDNDPNTEPVDLDHGVGCARLAVGFGGHYDGDLGIKITSLSPFSATPYIPAALQNDLAHAALDWTVLLQALPNLLDRLEATLDGTSANTKLPLVGDTLDAGANVVGNLRDHIVTPLANLGQQVNAVVLDNTDYNGSGSADALDVHDKIQDLVFQATSTNGHLLQDSLTASPGTVDKQDVAVTMVCSGHPCIAGDPLTSIEDARLTLALGQGLGATGLPAQGCDASCVAGMALPFDIGLDGLPLRLTGSITPHVGWRALIDFGLSRADGPYLVVAGPGHGSSPELQVGAGVGLGTASCDPADPNTFPGRPADLGGYSENTCLTGTLGFLGVSVRDGADAAHATPSADDDPTGINLLATVDLNRRSGSGDRIKLLDIPSALGADFSLSADANVDARVRTGLRVGEAAGLPSIYGTFHLGWHWGTGTGGQPVNSTTPTISFGDLYLDAGGFITQYLQPLTNEVKNITSPLKPIIDTLQAPIPVVSDLAELVGADPITLISLMRAIGGSDLDVVDSVIAFIDFANHLPTDSGLIPLGGLASGSRQPGSFNVDASKAKSGPQTPTTAGQLVQPVAGGSGASLLDEVSGHDRPVPAMHEDRPSTFGVPGLSFPIMENAGNIFSVLMGQDQTLVRYDLGTMSATAGFSYSFGPFFIGPVPVTVNLGGSATINGRFAFGYDTSGLRKVLAGGSGEHLFDGIFLDDLDSHGVDVPEVQLIGEVTAGAAVDLVVISAGIEGGLRLTVNLNLNDSPNPDGKLHIEEIFNKLNNPICLFDVSGSLDAFLRAFVEIDLFFYSDRFEFELVNITLLDFSSSCQPPQPVLAVLNPTNGQLTLNMGSDGRRHDRQISVDEINEKFTVRKLGPGRVSVSAFGAYQEFGDSAHPVTSVYGDGDTGDDVVSLLPGASNTVDQNAAGTTATVSGPSTETFDIPATINGGPGSDAITTGDANDTIHGDGGAATPLADGNDKINAGGGADTVLGDGGDDQIDGQLGDDTLLSGGVGNDTVNGGPGADVIHGDENNDALTGGPGSQAADPAHPEAKDDLGDTIVGGSGEDSIQGGFGDDFLHGDTDLGTDFETACANNATGGFAPPPARDQVDGGPGTDLLTGGRYTDSLVGGDGNDFLCGNAGNDTIEGDSDTSTAPGNDKADGGSGNDVVRGRAGADLLRGGSGNDHVLGGIGNDDMLGGTGRDLLEGEAGVDVVLGDDGTIDAARVAHVGSSSGSDSAWNCAAYSQTDATPGNADCINGGSEGDLLYGEGSADQLFGEDGADYIEGNAGPDQVRGGRDGDTIHGNNGADHLFGDSGNDTMFGDADCDELRGGIGDDHIEGNGGADTAFGDADQDDIIGGSSIAGAEDNQADCADGLGLRGDRLIGGAAQDVILGDNGTVVRPSPTAVDPDDNAPVPPLSATVARTVTLLDVNSQADAIAGPDFIDGGEANDRLYGQGENDDMHGGNGIDRMEGNAASDAMFGDGGNDLMLGGSSGTPASDRDAGDAMNGGGDDDVIVGDNGAIAWNGSVTPPTGENAVTFGVDTIHGNDGYDRIYGELAGDSLYGDAGGDYILGDRGTVTPVSTPVAIWPGGARNNSVSLFSPETGGLDFIYGNGGDDHLYGGWANDTMEGGPADDYMEGNGGKDRMFGLAESPTMAESLEAGPIPVGTGDQDDMIGGSSSTDSPDPRKDEGELEMRGNLEQDVMAGDNADIVRTVSVNPAVWAVDNITGGAARSVTLLDREKTGAALTVVSGGDTMLGNEGNDRMYGQGGQDVMKGNAQDDYLEGNQDADQVEGNSDEDDVIGGSSLQSSPGIGDPDAADALYGGGGADVVVGDNAIVTRDQANPGGAYDWSTVQYNWLPPATDRWVRFLDKTAVANPTRFGADVLSGGSQEDVLFGQDGNDAVYGGSHDDYMEGNAGADTLYGDAVAPPVPGNVTLSAEPDLNGLPGAAGQDDQIGGSSLVKSTASDGAVTGQRDEADQIHGDGAADFQLGDNGRILRRVAGTVWKDYFAQTGRHTVLRQGAFQANPETKLPARYDVGAPAASGVWGADTLYGDGGDDYQFAQDGNDFVYGGANDDDQYGELGDDRLFGESGQDAQIGDRGLIIDRLEDGSRQVNADTKGPGFFVYKGLLSGQYDRRVTLTDDGDGAPQQALGLTVGGNDRLRGGPDHDSMHGAYGDDLMNGESGGDWLFGDQGADVMWGGKGSDDPANPNDRGVNDSYVDYLFGGHGGTQADEVAAADILDFLPRSPGPGFTGDPDEWFEMTNMAKGGIDPNPADDQYHQGIDWIYGGFDRDVLEGDVGKNGPDFGDRLMDWNGAYNLFTRCNASYGDDGDIRQHSPAMQQLLQTMAFGSGAGLTSAEVTTEGTSAFEELGLVYPGDKGNAGKAFPTTPGHFEQISCSPGTPPK